MKKKIALITGGTSGVGKETVYSLLADGFYVSTFSNNESDVEGLKKELKEKFKEDMFMVMYADISDENQVREVVTKTKEKFTRIDVLFNNAGIGYFEECDKLDPSKFQKMIQVNLFGLTLITNFVVPIMKEQKTGLIINMSSIWGKMGNKSREFYSATKFGVVGYSDGIRSELKDFGIKVTTLFPGPIDTGFHSEEEIKRREEIWGGDASQKLQAIDVALTVGFICRQPDHCNISEITVLPFPFEPKP